MPVPTKSRVAIIRLPFEEESTHRWSAVAPQIGQDVQVLLLLDTQSRQRVRFGLPLHQAIANLAQILILALNSFDVIHFSAADLETINQLFRDDRSAPSSAAQQGELARTKTLN